MQWWDHSLEDLEKRVAELDEWSRVRDNPGSTDEQVRELYEKVFPQGAQTDDFWNDYHRVRAEYDRRAAEEYDLGQ